MADKTKISSSNLVAMSDFVAHVRTRKSTRASVRLSKGDRVDQYRIIRLLGVGGMGEVYLARDVQLGRKVALKFLAGSGQKQRRFSLRSILEARTTARFSHANIVTLYGFGEFAGSAYLALEYLDGQDLAQRIQQSALNVQEACEIGAAIASALAETHRLGILHLDLKPHNIVVTQEGIPKLVDFGLAQPLAAEPTADEVDVAAARLSFPDIGGAVPGTPAYMAPEQWQRRPRSAATDVWALGVMLFEMMTGNRPFAEHERNLEHLANAILKFDAPKMSNTASSLAELISQCLARCPEARPTANEVADQLRGHLRQGASYGADRERPFRGLLAFTSDNAGMFFGREREIAEIVERLRTTPVLTIVGASGAGKSSLVQAGIVPYFAHQGWGVLSMRPGTAPFETLAARLTGRDATFESVEGTEKKSAISEPLSAESFKLHPERLSAVLEKAAFDHQKHYLLVVDQLEELFTLNSDEQTQTAFMRAVAGGADDPQGPVRILCTLRDDYLSRVAEAGQQVRRVLRQVFLLQVPEPGVLPDTLTRPLKMVGYRYEDPELVARMVSAVGHNPASLPLLQFTAQKLWEARDTAKKQLTWTAYNELGGVEGALAKHADGVLDTLSSAQGLWVRHILLRLVTADNTRRVVRKDQLTIGLPEAAQEVVVRLVDARLLSSVRLRDEHGIHAALELAHESLIHSWNRLQGWLEDQREERRFLADIEQAAALWQKRGRRADEVWTKDALADALRMRTRLTLPVSSEVDAFLAAGRTFEQRGRNRRRGLVAAVVVGLSLALVVVYQQRQNALQQKEIAVQAQRQALRRRAESDREGAAAALVRGGILEARAKVRMSFEVEDHSLTRSLWWQMADNPLVWKKAVDSEVMSVRWAADDRLVLLTREGSVQELDIRTTASRVLSFFTGKAVGFALSSDSRYRLRASEDNHIEFFEIDRQQVVWRGSGHTSAVWAIHANTHERLVATGDLSGKIIVWDFEGNVLSELQAEAPVRGLAVGRGQRLVSIHLDRFKLWDLATGRSSTHEGKALRRVGLVPNKPVFATLGGRSIHLYRLSDGALLHAFDVKVGTIKSFVFTKDGTRLAVVGTEPRVVILEVDGTGRRVIEMSTEKAGANSVVFSRDGRFLVTGGDDNTLRLWDLGQSANATPLPRVSQILHTVSFSRDGRLIAVAGRDERLYLWNAETGQIARMIEARDGAILSTDFSRDGRWLALSGRTLRVADMTQPDATRLIRGQGTVNVACVRFSPDGRLLVTAEGWAVRIYDFESGRKVAELQGHQAAVRDVAFSPDGRQIASASFDRTVRLWDLETLTTVAVLSDHEAALSGLVFSPDGKFLVTSTWQGQLRQWDLRTRAHQSIGLHSSLVSGVDLSADGRSVAVASIDRTAGIWDLVSRRHIRALEGHYEQLTDVAFDTTGHRLATVSTDRTLRVFDVSTGKPLWHAPALLASPVEKASQEGWVALQQEQPHSPSSAAWRQAVLERGRKAVEIPHSRLLCLVDFEDGLEIWDRDADMVVRKTRVSGFEDLDALPTGCVVRTSSAVQLHTQDTLLPRSVGKGPAEAAQVTGKEILVSRSEGIQVFDGAGRLKAEFDREPHVCALAATADTLWLGYRHGGVTRRPRSTTASVTWSLQDTPSAAVTRIVLGPRGTLVVGFRDGNVGLWRQQTGERLLLRQLHGPVEHILVDHSRIYALSELGDHLDWDLSILEVKRCRLLQDIWSRVPVVWSMGRAVRQGPPEDHPCRAELSTRSL